MRPQLTEQWVITRRIQHQMTSKVRGAGLPALMLCGIRELWGPVNILVLDEHSFPYHTTKICFSLTITRFCLDEKSLFLQEAMGSLLSPVLFHTSHFLADTNSALKWLFLIYSPCFRGRWASNSC